MGSLAKARKRANNKKNIAARKARDKVSQGGRFASKDDRDKSFKNQNTSTVQQGGRFISQAQRDKQLADKFKNANLEQIIAAQRRGEIDARNAQQAIQKGIQERKNKILAQARSSQNRGAARRQAMQDVKAAKQSQQNIQQAIKDKKQQIANAQIALAKSEENWRKNRRSRAQIRAGNPTAKSLRKTISSLNSQLSQLEKASTQSQGLIDQASKQQKHVEASAQFGGFSTKKAQDEALKRAIAESKRKHPDAIAKATASQNLPRPDRPTSLSQVAAKKSTILVGTQTVDAETVQNFDSQSIISPLPDLPKSLEEAEKRLTEKSIVSNPIKDVGKDPNTNLLAGLADPFVNFGVTVANVPGAVIKEVNAIREGKHVDTIQEFFGASPAGQLLGSKAETPGSKFHKEVVEPELVGTASSDLLSGKAPDLSDPRKQGSIIGELALILAPAAAGKFARGGKTVDNTKVIKNVKSQTVQKGEVFFKPINPYRRQVPRDVFDLDTATPSNFRENPVALGAGQGQVNPFLTTEFPLGFGLGSIVKGGGSVPKFGNFGGTTKGGGTFVKKTFDEPTIRPGDNVLDTGKGTVQIAKTKQVAPTKSKQVTKQNTKVKSKEQSVTDDILFGKKRKLKPQPQDQEFVYIPRVRQTKSQKQIDALDWIRQPQKQSAKQSPKQSAKQKQKEKLATGFIASSKQKFAQPQKTDQAFDFITPVPARTSLTEVPPKPPTVIPRPPGFLPPFFGGGRKGDNLSRRKRGSKRFIVSNVDPLRVGVIAATGVPEQQESKSRKLFTKIDKQLAKSRKRPGKTPKPNSLLSDPLGTAPKKKAKKSDIGLDGFDIDIKF